MDSLILKILCMSIFFTSVIRAAAPEPPLPKFGDVVQVMGNVRQMTAVTSINEGSCTKQLVSDGEDRSRF